MNCLYSLLCWQNISLWATVVVIVFWMCYIVLIRLNKLLWMSLSLHWVFRIGPSNLKVLNRICMLLKTFEWVIIIFTIFSVSSLLVTKINNQIPIICNTSIDIEWLADNCEYPLIELTISHPVKTYVKIFTIVGYHHQHMFGFRLDHPKSCLTTK